MTTPTAPAADGSGKITHDALLAAALEIIDRDGADALSTRRLARAPDRDPMILYRHAPGKAALLDGVAETVLATPLGLRPLGTLRPLEDILALLTRAGFSGPDALHIYRALFGFLHGHVLDELQELTVSPDETDDLLRLGLHRLPIGDFPPAPRPGRLRRRRRTRTRPRHPAHQARRHPDRARPSAPALAMRPPVASALGKKLVTGRKQARRGSILVRSRNPGARIPPQRTR